MLTRRQVIQGLGAITILGLAGCGRDGNQAACAPVPFGAGDECVVCGMYITEYPGPKGQVCLRGGRGTAKFCSTADMFAWLLQPESRALVDAVFVHDMGRTDWQRPADDALVDAREAWYVLGHPLPGAMGPTLAAFALRADADALAAEHEGRVLAYAEIDHDVIHEMNASGHRHGGHGHGGHDGGHGHDEGEGDHHGHSHHG